MEQKTASVETINKEIELQDDQIIESDIPDVSHDVVDNNDEEEDYEEDYSEQQSVCSSDMDSMDQKVAIDLSDNEFYKGLCTLLEDEHGNNILEYVSLLHTELIGVNKNLRTMNKTMNRIANCSEMLTKKSM